MTPLDTNACAVAPEPPPDKIVIGGAALYPVPPLVTVIAETAPLVSVAVATSPAPGPLIVVTPASSNARINSYRCKVNPFV